MACQKVCKKVGIMHESKGQHIGKAPSLHLFHTTVRQYMRVFLKRTTNSQPLLAVHGCSLILRPLPFSHVAWERPSLNINEIPWIRVGVELFTRPLLPSPLSPRPYRKGLRTKLDHSHISRKMRMFYLDVLSRCFQSRSEGIHYLWYCLQHWRFRLCTGLASRPMTEVFGLGTKVRAHA